MQLTNWPYQSISEMSLFLRDTSCGESVASINIKSVLIQLYLAVELIMQPTKTQVHGVETQPFINIHFKFNST